MRTVLFFLLLLPFCTMAQINESDTLNIKANLSLTGFFQTGNVETIIFRATTSLSFKPWKRWVFKNQNSYVFQEFGKTKADEDILSLNFLYLNPKKKLYPFVLGFVSTNFRREINVRYLFGGGVTYQILNKNKDWLKISVSTEYERTNFSRADFNRASYNSNKSINAQRATIWLNGKYHLFKNKMLLSHESYFQPSLSSKDNYRWEADINLDFPIWKYLNFRINYKRTFESIVIKNQQEEDQFLTFGFTLKSY